MKHLDHCWLGDAVHRHFEEENGPKIIRLHHVREEVIAA